MNADAITVRGLLVAAAGDLGGDESTREVELLLGHALGRDRAWLYAHADDPLPVADAVRFHALLKRRAEGEPMAYITGHREFWSLDLLVTPAVLIPRAETELLVEVVLRHVPQGAQMEIADLGTGSGAIALAIARERPRVRVLATEVSDDALDVARSNAERLGIRNVEFAQGSWCEPLLGRQFDLIVANPPYVAEADLHLVRGDLRFEPPVALASGNEGLDAMRTIIRDAPAHLKPGGRLLFEHGFEQGGAARERLTESGFVEVFTESDLEQRERVSGGVHPR